MFKTSKTECTKACRSWLTRHAMFGAISKLRKQIDAEIKALNELLGNGIVAVSLRGRKREGRERKRYGERVSDMAWSGQVSVCI